MAALLGPQILAAALEEFLERGFESANMDRIAAAAQVTKRTIYTRFESKQGLFFAAIAYGVERYAESVVISVPCGSLKDRVLDIGRKALDLSLQPDVIRFERLMQWVADERLRAPQRKLPVVSDGAVEMFRSVLREHEGANLAQDDLEFLANYLCDLLIFAPRNRILIQGSMENSPEAKADYFKRTMGMIAKALPFAID